MFKFTPEIEVQVNGSEDVNIWCLDILNCGLKEMSLAKDFCSNCKLCETLRLSCCSLKD